MGTTAVSIDLGCHGTEPDAKETRASRPKTSRQSMTAEMASSALETAPSNLSFVHGGQLGHKSDGRSCAGCCRSPS
jgi:hypothetical protein